MLRKTATLLIMIFLVAEAACAGECGTDKAMRYVKSYPDFFTSFKDGYLITKDGKKILFDDGKAKDLNSLVVDTSAGDEAFDPEDALHWNYPAGEAVPTAGNPPAGDPGRIRPAAVFQYMYGASKAERSKRMRSIDWVGAAKGKTRKVRMTAVNGVDKALERVAREIASLPEEKRKCLDRVVFNVDGPYGYYDRPVRDFPGRLSGHAYGISVDINGDTSYFIGGHKGEPYLYRNNVPRFLVDIFERNGFIWGGRWHSYDAMHFEYRPELLMK